MVSAKKNATAGFLRGVFLCRFQRHPHDETRAAFGRWRVFIMHAAVVQDHDVVDDRETKSGAAFHAVAIAAKETLEEIRLLLDRKSTRLNSSHTVISYA